MAYIVDLEIIMHRLSAIEISEERVISTLESYARSREIAQVHNDIRAFSSRILGTRLRGNDYTLDEIIRLIEKHRVQPEVTQAVDVCSAAERGSDAVSERRGIARGWMNRLSEWAHRGRTRRR